MNYLVLKDSLSLSLDSVEHPGRIKSAVTWNESCVCKGKPPPPHTLLQTKYFKYFYSLLNFSFCFKFSKHCMQ